MTREELASTLAIIQQALDNRVEIWFVIIDKRTGMSHSNASTAVLSPGGHHDSLVPLHLPKRIRPRVLLGGRAGISPLPAVQRHRRTRAAAARDDGG